MYEHGMCVLKGSTDTYEYWTWGYKYMRQSIWKQIHRGILLKLFKQLDTDQRKKRSIRIQFKGGSEPSNFEDLGLVNVSVKYLIKLCLVASKFHV